MTAPRAELPAELLETWEPREFLGAGAMGRVYAARHRREGFEAAIKVTLAPDDERLRVRLQREAEALARVQHPGVVRVFDGGVTAAGEAYVVMERLEGASLDQEPPPDPRAFMATIAEALAAVHAAGLLHRDIKPGNLFLTRDGQPKLVDFGLVLDPERTRLTATGMVAGTPIYMAPELLRLEDPRPASDWFAFGVTLYVLLEGSPPFAAEDFEKVCRGAPYPPPRFSHLTSDPWAREMLEGLLQSDPAARLVDAAEVVRGLSGQTMESYRPPPPAAPAGPSRGLVVASLAAAVAAGFFLGGPGEAKVPAVASAAPAAVEPAPRVALAARTAETWEPVDRAGRELYPEVPEAPLYCATWYSGAVPDAYRDRSRNALLGEPGAALLQRWERTVTATCAWLGDLRAAGKEQGDPQAALADPEIAGLLNRQLLPRLTRELEEQVLRWSQAYDPAQVEIGMLSPEGRGALSAFVNASHELRFALEDWGQPPPPPLLHLWVLTPRDFETPVAHGPTVLDAARRAVRQATTPVELWWAGRTLKVVVTFGPWFKDTSWDALLDALRELRVRIGEVPMPPAHRAALAAQMFPEAGRMGRDPRVPEDRGALEAEVEAWFALLRDATEAAPEYRVAGMASAWIQTRHVEGPWFNEKKTHPYPAWFSERFHDDFEPLLKRFGWDPLATGLHSDLTLPPPP